MRRTVFIFLAAVLSSILVIPLANILTVPNRDHIKWREKAFLYNADFALRWIALLLYPYGISTDPKQVVIGRDGWLFLGDRYEETRTVARQPATKADFIRGQEIGKATKAWEAYLVNKGVKLFVIMVAPNKASIYPEYLPTWAKSTLPNATDALFAGTGSVHYLDLRKIMLANKQNYPVPLYYKTDTHWNFLGAASAFQAFRQHVGKAEPKLQWPSKKIYELEYVYPRAGGDLAQFLRLATDLPDFEPAIHMQSLSVETTQVDFDTKKIVYQGGNPQVSPPNSPLLVQSASALNKRRILWLRDSFGIALSPFMAITFSDVLQLHWIEALKPGGRFVQLVEAWKPDYVFLTVVERDARNPWFSVSPPL